ncbi:hypothetical protein [Agromyces arachidis]|uniref:hypothetical protein n=1 Tax=Agromyces arachidis TaxID=766966 RepID=UPI004057A434
MIRPAVHRSARPYRCQFCGNEFHPNYSTKRLFCSQACVTAANIARQERMRVLRGAARSGTMSAEEIAAGLASLNVEPEPLYEEWEL